jgi:hypothetical protein
MMKMFSTPSSNSTPKQHRKRLKCFVKEKQNEKIFEVSTSQLPKNCPWGMLTNSRETTSLKPTQKFVTRLNEVIQRLADPFLVRIKGNFWKELIISTSTVSDEVVNNSSCQFSLPTAKRDIFDANYSYLDAVKTFCSTKKTISWQLTASI